MVRIAEQVLGILFFYLAEKFGLEGAGYSLLSIILLLGILAVTLVFISDYYVT